MKCRYLFAETLGATLGFTGMAYQIYADGRVDGDQLGAVVAFGAFTGYTFGAMFDTVNYFGNRFRQNSNRFRESDLIQKTQNSS